MSVHEMLCTLTSSGNDRTEKFDDKLARKLRETASSLIDEMRVKIDGQAIRAQYLQVLAYVLRAVTKLNAENTDGLFSVNQYRSLKIAVELIVSIGIVPCLQSGIGIDMAKLCPRALEIPEENLSCTEKYERLSFLICELVNLFDDELLKPAILLHLGPILAALLQLSYAPLAKPMSENERVPENITNQQFFMTVERYETLLHDQKRFHSKLVSLLNSCPQYMCIRELMVIHGKQNAPKWLRRQTQCLLISKITQLGGVLALITAICEDDLDIGADWKKLDTISKLLAAAHGGNAEEYYKAVCPQILDLLSADKVKYSSTIANYCIAALYDYNPSVCYKHIIDIMCEPLIIPESDAAKSEEKVERCIQTLTKCFIVEDAKFKHPSCKIILHVAMPLFCLYQKIHQSSCILRIHLQQLILKILEEKTMQDELYSAFLGHNISAKFGNYVMSEFGPTGGIRITGLLNEDPKYQDMAVIVLELVSAAKHLSSSVFFYVLKFLSNVSKSNERTEQREALETEDDKMRRLEMQLVAYMLLSQLASMSAVQDAQAKNPEPLLLFIKQLFDEYNEQSQRIEMERNDCETLYLSLMLIKTILVEKAATLEINLFKDFSAFLKCRTKIPTQLKLLINEVIDCIETHGKFKRKGYQDLSVNSASLSKFDEAIQDLSDPFLPVRAHGLITLTRLIENHDPCTIACKAIVLRLFKENLKHEDSFIYLASINGLCALTTVFPRAAIELLPEYINISNRVTGAEITVETRVKLGEILVKTTRALGELTVVHKNMLVNGFLCAIRDPDPLIRASSLSCLGELCKVLGFRLGNVLTEILYCITCIVKHDKVPECRRAAVLVATLLFRGLGKDTLNSLSNELVGLYRGLKYLRDNDNDPVLRLHAQLALEEIDQIVQQFLFSPPKLEKRIFMLD